MRPLRLLLLSAIAFAPVPQAHAQAYDPMAQAYTPYDPMASGPQAPATPQSPGTLSQAGRAAQQAAEESRRQAAENLDRGVRGQSDPTGVRGGLGQGADFVRAMQNGTDADRAQMRSSVNAQMESVRQAMQAGGVTMDAGGGQLTCDAHVNPAQAALEARARGAMNEYLAAAAKGDGAGINAAVARGQAATYEMSTNRGKGCTDSPSSVKPGSKIIDVKGGKPAKPQKSPEEREAELKALMLAVINNPGDKKKISAFEKAGRKFERDCDVGRLSAEDCSAIRNHLEKVRVEAATDWISKESVKLEGLIRAWGLDPGDDEKGLAYDKAELAFNRQLSVIMPEYEQEALEARFASAENEAVQEWLAKQGDELESLLRVSLEDPGNADNKAAFVEAGTEFMRIQGDLLTPAELAAMEARIQRVNEEASKAWMDKQVAEIEALLREAALDPTNTEKGRAYALAHAKFERLQEGVLSPENYDKATEQIEKADADATDEWFSKRSNELEGLLKDAVLHPDDEAKTAAFVKIGKEVEGSKDFIDPTKYSGLESRLQDLSRQYGKEWLDKQGKALEQSMREYFDDPSSEENQLSYLDASVVYDRYANGVAEQADINKVDAHIKKVGDELSAQWLAKQSSKLETLLRDTASHPDDDAKAIAYADAYSEFDYYRDGIVSDADARALDAKLNQIDQALSAQQYAMERAKEVASAP